MPSARDNPFPKGATGGDHADAIWKLAAKSPTSGPAADLHMCGCDIALPQGLFAVSGPGTEKSAWVGALQSGDGPSADGFQRLAHAGEALGADVIYGDDLTLAEGDGTGAAVLRLKPCFDPILLRKLDYMGRAVLFRRAALSAEALAALESGIAPSEIILAHPGLRVGHLPFPVMKTAPAAPNTIGDATEIAAAPKISIVIPNRDSPHLLRTVLDGVLTKTAAGDIELIIVDNGSTDQDTLAQYEALRGDPRVRIDMRAERFNFARMVNRGAARATGDVIVLLNNDIEIIHPDWLQRMLRVLAQEQVGIVGAKLLFPDRTIQHGGVIVGHGGVAGHDFKSAPEDADDDLHRLSLPHCREAVTAAAMMIRRQVWNAVGGFDERAFPVAFNDVDFCLRAGEAGWRVALAPDAVLVHHESVSRRGFSIRKFLAHQRERTMLRLRHHTIGRIDRFQNPWRDPDALQPQFRMLKTLPGPRF